jgi:nucleoside-diphosphate-sugar epimerase
VILGASGVIGSAVSRRLLADGVHVVAHGRDRSRLAQLQAFGASSVQGDIRDPATKSTLQRVGSDAISLISFLPPDPNVIASAARLMREMPGTYRLHLSSAAVYERSRDQYDLTERDTRSSGLTPCPFRSAERVLEREMQGCVTLIRPGRLYGPAALTGPLLRWAGSGPLPLVRGGEIETSVLAVDDLADAITHLLATPSAGRASGPFNLASSRPMPVRYLVGKMFSGHAAQVSWRPASRLRLRAGAASRGIIEALDRSGPAPVNVARLLGWSLTLNTGAFQRETGWSPRSAEMIGADQGGAGQY